MTRIHKLPCSSVRFLTLKLMTLCALSLQAGCAYLEDRYGESCKSHADIRQGVMDYISRRYPSGAPVRLGIIPFSVPANLTTTNNELPGLENTLTRKIYTALLDYQEIPIIEILNREDWPGKKEDFFTGNYGALKIARDAGYDLVLVGSVEPLTSLTGMTAYSKLMDTESGVTIWYGKSTVETNRRKMQDALAFTGLENRRPDRIYSDSITEELARCVAKAVMKD